MATTLVSDQFVEAATGALTAHTPSPTGTSWATLANSGAAYNEISGTGDHVRATASTASSYTSSVASPGATNPEQTVEATMTRTTTSSDDAGGLLGRVTDSNNFYACVIYPPAAAADIKIYKRVGGTITQIASGDAGVASGSVITLQLFDAAKKLFVGGAEQLSSSDNALTSAGKGGLFFGGLLVSTDDLAGSQWQWDNFLYTEEESSGTEYPQSVTGTLTSAGVIIRQARKSPGGAVASAGALVRRVARSLTGAVSSSGGMVKRTGRAFVAAISSAGALTRLAQKVTAGTVTSTGSVSRAVARGLTGSISSAGAIARQTSRVFSGAIASAGALTAVRTILVALTGALASGGALTRQTQRAVTGAMTSAGSVVKHVARALAGTMTSAGTLAQVKAALKDLAGTLTAAGTLTRQTGRSIGGTLTSAGTIIRRTVRALVGSLTPTAALAAVRAVFLALTGTLSSSGALTRRTGRATTGGLATAGALSRRTARAVTGAVTSAGALVRQAGKTVTGTLTSAGAVARRVGKGVAGTLTAAGTVAKVTALALTGVLSWVGTLLGSIVGVGGNEPEAIDLVGSYTPTVSLRGGVPVAVRTYAGAVLDDGPVAYWRLGETSGTTAVDESGNGRDGTYSGSTTLGAIGPLDDGNAAAEFAGGKVEAANALFGSLTGDLTLEAWIYPTSLATRPTWITKTWSGEFEFKSEANGGLNFYQNGGNLGGPAGSIVVNQWSHVVVTRTVGATASAITFFVNGVIVKVGSIASLPAVSTRPVRIGQDSSGGAFNGTIDDVAVYDRALSSDELTEHYALRRSIFGVALDGSYAPTLEQAGSYAPTVEASGSYHPSIALDGSL